MNRALINHGLVFVDLSSVDPEEGPPCDPRKVCGSDRWRDDRAWTPDQPQVGCDRADDPCMCTRGYAWKDGRCLGMTNIIKQICYQI